MFFCGNFCNGVPDQPQIEVTAQQAQKLRDSDRNWNESAQIQPQQKQKQKQDKILAMIKQSNYKKYHAQCKASNRFFTDKQFPPNDKSLDFKVEGREITWKRISQIIPNFVMRQNDINPGDIQQGNIGDCYFLASIAALAQNPLLIQHIFLNSFDKNGYGLYKVIANIDGIITQIVIDDYIPVFAKTERPVFCKSNGKQVWTMLLQKAWAKIKGSYGKINNGNPYQVLNTFSLAPVYNYSISKKIDIDSIQAKELWQQLLKADKHNYPTVAGTKQDILLNGLKPQHSYTILKSGEVRPGNSKSNEKQVKIMRLRNPWGNTQYNGAYSDTDTTFWNKVQGSVKKQFVASEGVDDGDFTIPFNVFLQNFETIDMVHFRKSFSLFFKDLTISHDQAGYIQFQVTHEHQAYITAQKAYETLDVKQHIEKTKQYGHIRMVLAKQIPSSHIQAGHDHRYEYYSSNYDYNCCQSSIQCTLVPGKYKALIDSGYPAKFNSKYKIVCSYYYPTPDKSESKTFQVSHHQDKLEFLQNLYLNHAHRNQKKVPLSGRPKDWVKSAVLKTEGGLAYIACSLDPSTNFKLKITCDQNEIKKNGFTLWSYSVNYILPGEEKIFLFGFDEVEATQQDLLFPPKGFKITIQM